MTGTTPDMNADKKAEPPPSLQALGRLVGAWTTEATHPAMPGVLVHGTADMAWLEGGRFLCVRSTNDHPDFPDALAVIGDMGEDRVGGDETAAGADAGADADAARLQMHYFDSRGVFRVYETNIDETAWRWWRDAPSFSQRFTGAIAADGSTIVGHSQLCKDDIRWSDDLQITYRRVDRGS